MTKRKDPKPKQVSHEGGTSGLIEVQVLPLSKLVGNTGQIEGLPKNPRIIRDEKFAKLKKSIEDDPEMLELRELLVYPHGDRYVVIGGNMRLRVLLDLKATEAPCKVIPADWPAEKLRAIATKDNVSFGEFDWDALANEWDADKLGEWGLPIFQSSDDPKLDDFFKDDPKKDGEKGAGGKIVLEYTEADYIVVTERLAAIGGTKEQAVFNLLTGQ